MKFREQHLLTLVEDVTVYIQSWHQTRCSIACIFSFASGCHKGNHSLDCLLGWQAWWVVLQIGSVLGLSQVVSANFAAMFLFFTLQWLLLLDARLLQLFLCIFTFGLHHAQKGLSINCRGKKISTGMESLSPGFYNLLHCLNGSISSSADRAANSQNAKCSCS